MKETGIAKLKEDAFPLAFLFILPLLYLKEALFFTDNILGSPLTDIKVEAYGKLFGYRELLNSSIPLWNPYHFAGMPFAAAPGTAFFYPFNLICAFLPIHYAINWDIALHLFFSETFTYYLLRNYGVTRFGSMMAGIVYAFSAPQIMHIYAGHLIAVTSMPWTPLLFLFLDKLIRGCNLKYGILLSVAIALQLLAGYTQYLFYSMIAISLYSLLILINLYLNGRGWAEIGKRGLFFAIFVLFGIFISGVQILPTMEMMNNSTRQNLTYEWVSIFSFPPENLITLLVPDFFGDMLNTSYWGKNYLWEMTAYVGIFPLLLAFVAIFYARRRVVWFFAGLTILSIILSMGKYTPLLKFLYHYFPGFNLFRGNSKFIFLTALSISVLSGFGMDALMKGLNNIKRFRLGILGVGVFLSTGLSTMSIALEASWFRGVINKVLSSPDDIYSDVTPFLKKGFEDVVMMNFRNGIVWTSVLLVSGVTILLLHSYGKIKEKIVVFAIFGIVIFDLFTFGMRYMTTFDIRETYLDKEVVTFLKKDKGPFRVVAPELNPNMGMASGIETLSGYDNMMIRRYSEFINLSQDKPLDRPDLWLNITKINPLTNLLNAKYIVLTSTPKLKGPSYKLIFDNGSFSVYHDIKSLPRAFVVHAEKVITDRESIFREMSAAEFNPTAYAIVEEESSLHLTNSMAKSPLPRFIEYSPNVMRIEAYLNHPGLLVLGDVYFPGWKAFVDGKETKIYKTNYVMRGVAVPQGRHIVEFRYDPLSFKIGASISLMSLIFVACFLIWDWRRDEDYKTSA